MKDRIRLAKAETIKRIERHKSKWNGRREKALHKFIIVASKTMFLAEIIGIGLRFKKRINYAQNEKMDVER